MTIAPAALSAGILQRLGLQEDRDGRAERDQKDQQKQQIPAREDRAAKSEERYEEQENCHTLRGMCAHLRCLRSWLLRSASREIRTRTVLALPHGKDGAKSDLNSD